MADKHAVLDTSVDAFFLRCGLTAQDQLDCYNFVKDLFPGKPRAPASCQGYCSFTIFIGDDTVVQFRPPGYQLDLRIADAACEVYGTFAPETKYTTTIPTSGLMVYTMGRMQGVSYKDFRASSSLTGDSTYRRALLCRDFAVFLSRAWLCDNTNNLPLGKVGKTLVSRLEALSTDLPSRFQPKARNVLIQLHHIDALPWVLTHGDIVTGNIMVDPSTGRLTGFVDWAEAERLPFGICLYGLEEILGEMTPAGFQYYPDASDLREIFWAELAEKIPEMRESAVVEAVKLSRDLGVLLWHGIAFDNGAIDRVVQEGRDIDEIHRLHAFLDSSEQQRLDRNSKI